MPKSRRVGVGAFTPAARAAILEAALHRCVGCGAADGIEAHHRDARGMGGTSNPLIGQPWNGLALCQRHHAWAESHRHTASALGWLATPNHDAPYGPDTPYWTLTWGWCTWALLTDDRPTWCVVPYQPPPNTAAAAAVAAIP